MLRQTQPDAAQTFLAGRRGKIPAHVRAMNKEIRAQLADAAVATPVLRLVAAHALHGERGVPTAEAVEEAAGAAGVDVDTFAVMVRWRRAGPRRAAAWKCAVRPFPRPDRSAGA